MTNSKRKPLWAIGIVLIAIGCICSLPLLEPILGFITLIVLSIPGSQPISAPEVFPNTDIIYVGGKGLGFINADGSGQETFRFRAEGRNVLAEGMEIYLMTGDRKTLITVYTGYGTYDGSIYMAHPGEVAMKCGWVGITQLTSDQKYILIGTEQGSQKYLLTDCGTGNSPVGSIDSANGIVSPDEQYSVETEYGWNEQENRNKSDLTLRNLVTHAERVVEDGRFPAWSRDSQWLAYTGVDGIYVIGIAPNAKPRRVVTLESREKYFRLYNDGQYPPVVSWSPDGKWLVYHAENEHPKGETIDYYYSIFKVNLETGEVIKLLESGMFPYWIWPAERSQ